MNIRSITAFANLTAPVDTEQIVYIGKQLARAKEACEMAGLPVQTTRLATQPFPHIVDTPEKAVAYAKSVEVAAHDTGIDYISLGPVRLDDEAAYAEALPAIFTACKAIFASVEVATTNGGIDPARVRLAARLIKQISGITPDGFANLMMATLANVGPWSPFFPAAYHGGGPLSMAVATESADLAVAALTGAESLHKGRTNLQKAIAYQADLIVGVFANLGMTFKGIDFSLAPFPEDARSIGRALEALGVGAFGQGGSLAAAAWLTDTLDGVNFPRVGFSGLMLPVLEDSGLAERAAEGVLRVSDLLTYSAVCGTGLDTIPLAGDVSEAALTGTLFDMAALALRLDKPLTARLMPIPDKQAGELTDFDFEYFANSRVMALGEASIHGPLNAEERIHIGARSSGGA